MDEACDPNDSNSSSSSSQEDTNRHPDDVELPVVVLRAGGGDTVLTYRLDPVAQDDGLVQPGHDVLDAVQLEHTPVELPVVVLRAGGGDTVPTSGLDPVAQDDGRVQPGHDVLDAVQLEHTPVPPPVLPWDRGQVQVHADLEERPQVSLLQRTPSSPVVCHATGFYPDRVMVFWKRDDQQLDEHVSGEVLPNHDGTFQVSVDLDLSSLDGIEDIVTRLDPSVILSNRVRP
ncbi:hypothetical protein CRUP_027417, partial [Coryphaenoides rupestris]